MNNLTTRKIVLGMLMALVLAFSVQGIADALTLTKSSGDLVTVSRNQTFTIKFSIDPDSRQEVKTGTTEASATDIEYASGDRTRPGPSNDQVKHTITTDVGYSAGDTHYYTVTTTATRSNTANVDITITTNTRNWLSESGAYDYNDEALAISVDQVPSNAADPTFRRSGTVIPLGTAINPSMQERHEVSDRQLSTGTRASTITLIGSSGSAGEYTITIADVTADADFPDTPPSERASIVFTVYVVKDRDTAATGLGFSGLSAENYRTDGTDFSDETVTAVPQPSDNGVEHVRIEYKVVAGSGRLYVQEGNRKSSAVTTLSTSSAAEVQLDMRGTTNKVRASIAGVAPVTAIFIFGYPTVVISVSSNNQEGVFGGRLENPLVVKVTDGKSKAISGLAAIFDTDTGGNFIPVPGTTVYLTGSTWAATYTADTVTARETYPAAGAADAADAAKAVQTDSRGEARIYYQLGDAEPQTVTVIAGGVDPITPSSFRFTEGRDERRPVLSILSGNNQRTDKNGDIDPLVVVVTQDGNLKPSEQVEFRTKKGTLIGRELGVGNTVSLTSKRVYGTTNASGEARVTYYQDPGEGSDTVTATISGVAPADYEGTVTFNINGRGGSGPSEPSNAITITLSSTTGEPGEEIDVTVSSDPSAVVVLDSGDLDDDDFSRLFGTTPFDITISLPDEEGEYDFSAEAPGYTSDSATVTVEAELGTLSITAIGTASAGTQTFSISAVDADGDRASAPFTARLSGTGFTSRNVEISGGRGNARVTLPTAARLYTLTVSATGYEDGETQVRIAGTGQQQVADEDEEEVEEEVTVAAEPDSIEITGPSTRSGTVNEELDTPLLVRVLDDDGDGLEGARVFYRVSSGRGRLSARGNGRAIGVVTDSDGYARAVFTPLDGGTITVRANTDDLSATVTFTITTGSAPSASGARDSGTGGTPGTISPVVHVAAASRPPMLWVDGGAIYALVGASPQRFAPGVDNALNIAIGGGKVYWTEKTGESGGTINSANLNGSDVAELTSIKAVPMGIAVDVAGSKLYWTNSRGRIQSADLDGSGITNVMQNLPSPMDLALAGGNAYWTQGNGSVRFVNLRGQKVVRNISTGTDTPGSLVIGGGKVYWTEMTGESGGTVNSANLNGTGATPLASILAAPMGIAVDGSRSKLYWTNSRGRVQSANLDGSGITNVVSGLGSPGELVLSNSITAPAAAPAETASGSKYDVNGDGTVDNADSDAVTVAIAAGATDAKYDVNGDGTVNVFDLVEIIANRDPGAAGAPTLFGMKMTAVQIDHLQEQIDLLIATNDRSPAAMRTLIYLQQLLVTARPEKTLLLANYPNPFNPETWIPYELATDTNVRLTIYNTQGVVIRSLQLGHQSAGYYTGRDRAAYWDGRNALGEQVASGLYFYQLETDEMSLMRKMVILK